MDKRGYTQVVGVAIFLIIIFVVFFVIIPELTPPAELRINFQTNQIVQGQQGILFYKVTANKGPLENVVITNFIVTREQATQKETSAGRMIEGVTYADNYLFETNSLVKGEKYVVKTELEYIYKNESRKEELTLAFEVF